MSSIDRAITKTFTVKLPRATGLCTALWDIKCVCDQLGQPVLKFAWSYILQYMSICIIFAMQWSTLKPLLKKSFQSEYTFLLLVVNRVLMRMNELRTWVPLHLCMCERTQCICPVGITRILYFPNRDLLYTASLSCIVVKEKKCWLTHAAFLVVVTFLGESERYPSSVCMIFNATAFTNLNGASL